jgi:dUTP pyrophosphatase
MNTVSVKIRLRPGAKIPEYKSEGSAGADVCALLEHPLTIEPGTTVLVPTGIFIELPEGYEAQIRPRSGLAIHHGITLLNTPGTIDSDYRGEIQIIMTNFGAEPFVVENGMRIAQMVISRMWQGDFQMVDELERTKRDEGGFGHTGIS